ncbi:MAG: response regulator [Candidatus Omnitrophica bacterium]|nr:response regulator [Candidatus Omnitrophota bacterium]
MLWKKRKTWKILIVDDNLADLELFKEVLKDMGEIYLAINGREAWDGYISAFKQEQPFDIILLDLVMPEMDGAEVLSKVREFEKKSGVVKGQEVPIVMVTAFEKPFMKDFNRTCDDYMLKPIDVLGILGKVRSKIEAKEKV